MTNALANETSPYLLQHQDNPVDWLPWGDEALRRAREEDKPLLVSIGYSSCHWCHVMERESFVDEQTAQVMNEHFVCVKVDREERPDVDAIYMEAVQAMTGHGGWPLNVFVTPDQVPFYGGTYFPPAASDRMPSWTQVLLAVAEAWRTKRDEIREQGERMAQRLAATAGLRPSPNPIRADVLEEAHIALRTQFDQDFGGFGGAPKFPPASVLTWLLERDADPMALRTLRMMAFGGIHDQVGGGFSRYAVDRTWTVPHFEKMLYDNALLLRAYVLGFRRTGDALYREVAERLVGWLQREMAAPDGGFYAALDADTDHVEGATYTWTIAELRDVLGPDADAAIAWFGAGEGGNFVDPHHPQPGLNVLRGDGPRPDDATADRIRAALLERRDARPQPGLDDKRLTAWNALMIGALADAGRHLGRPDWVALASGAADFVLRALRTPEGALLRTYNHGHAKLDAYLDDHAYLVEALLDLYEATFEPRWFSAAQEIADALLARFADPENGGFFQTAADAPALVARRRDLEDAPTPSGSSSAALGLLRLAAFTGESRYADAAVSHLRLVHELCGAHPQAFAHTLRAIAWHTGDVREIALAGEPEGVAALRAVVDEAVRPHVVVAGGLEPATPPLMAGRRPLEGRAAAYVCEHFACQAPVAEPDELRAALG